MDKSGKINLVKFIEYMNGFNLKTLQKFDRVYARAPYLKQYRDPKNPAIIGPYFTDPLLLQNYNAEEDGENENNAQQLHE